MKRYTWFEIEAFIVALLIGWAALLTVGAVFWAIAGAAHVLWKLL